MTATAAWDVIIVGAGASGHSVAQTLTAFAASGRRVLLLERGGAGPVSRTEVARTPDVSAWEWSGAGPSPDVEWDAVVPTHEDIARAWPAATPESMADAARRTGALLGTHDGAPPHERDTLFAEGAARIGLPVRRVSVRRGLRLPPQITVWHGAEVTQLHERSLTVQVSHPAPDGTPAGTHHLVARCVVLTAGVPGSPALLLTSPMARALGRLGDAVMLDPSVLVIAEHSRALSRGEVLSDTWSVEAPREGWGLRPIAVSRRVAADAVVGLGSTPAAVASAFPRVQVVQAMATDDASAGHRVERRADGTVRVRHHVTEAVRDRLVEAQRAAVRAAFGAGAVRVFTVSAGAQPMARDAMSVVTARVSHARPITGVATLWSSHAAGGAPMGRSARDGVADACGRVFGAPWLRVADASLANASLGLHPTLAVMGLAAQVAATVVQDWPALADGAAA